MGFGDICVKRIQGNFFLIEIQDEELLEILKQREWSYLKEFFINIVPWLEILVFFERITWIEVSGVPMHCWNYEMFKRIAGKWGNLVSIGENLLGTNNFEKVEMLISISQVKKIDEMVLLEVGDVRFPVSVREVGWSEDIKNNVLKKPSNQAVIDESVLESEPTFGVELEKGLDGTRIVSSESIMENAIENVNRKRHKGLGSDGKIVAINRLVRIHRVNVCFLQETKLEKVSGDLVRRIWGEDYFEFRFAAEVGRSGGLITIWDKSSFITRKVYCTNRLIVVERNWCCEGWEGVLINVYTPNGLLEQKIFWVEILEVRDRFTYFWIVGGDSNAIRNKSDKSNRVGLLRGSKDFLSSLERCKLVDLPLLRRKFTWYGPENKKSRLDWFLGR
ncbi:hypothetical protein ES332_A07G145500v1 [Gossypium tomentosum]|uniref:Uncharacterized protein n=1 Tax=Gossypium tomentosum TaxID=34277 RepID=A0A5D2PV61_GOSTO|nr:hypothetical protein ES332_A07G145500v1 [Gossypium tomentosum]